ncbi:DUF4124 domain-containing protein [Methylotuvimicrobium alcaliphilum]|uniref:DUF4124 domain-containing protein n=1 Tax=Methylotuvimicrobium alcaliphilum (strain DSM 19304 / NCIMB 14124 / VKM B-2133 / 20Z) TaxID=1091494 RepID=G4SUK9_META2|nr:DUF4124 domain-containing protein [Methylotuvimicrobium alcaliphilum]CCE21835.1 conserved exported protein of unknown function [Methylotuvimicrobium alcaliphilum 20Z]
MPIALLRKYLNIAAVTLLLCHVPSIHAKKMYRWVDDQGNTYFSDQVPPEHAKHRREALNQRGRVIDVIEKAKTKEELELDQRLNELREAQEKIIQKQQTYDRVLLSTFRNIDDLLLSIKNKTRTMEAQIRATEGNLNRLKSQLSGQQRKAAAFERNAQRVPESLLKDIRSTQEQIQQTEIAISRQMETLNQVKKEDDADVERYLFLTQSRTDTQPKQHKIPSIKEANELGLFYCENDHQCNQAWEIARTFVTFHSTTGPDIDTDKLIMTRSPSKDSDLSLSLSKIAISDVDYQLFLDIRCRDSSLGRELCASQRVSDIRSAFRPYINDALSRSTE